MSDSVSSADLMPPPQTSVPLAKAMLLTAMAGGMGWGIRGQYGHETGAMIAGVLVASVLVMLFASVYTTLHAARAIAWTTIVISFGGCMTYGQTVGLTHDTELIGNTQALRWGLLGLFIKGGIWIGFGGLALACTTLEQTASRTRPATNDAAARERLPTSFRMASRSASE